MGYHEVHVIADGALSDTYIVADDVALAELVVRLWDEFPEGDPPWELFNIWHDHRNDGKECVCVSFLDSHKPFAVIGDEPKHIGTVLNEVREGLRE